MTRANLRRNLGDLHGTLADEERAVELMEALRDRLKAEQAWPPQYQLSKAH